MVATRFSVEGLTCGRCLGELLDQLRSLPEVTGAAADLVVGGSTIVAVIGDAEVVADRVRWAVQQAGFLLEPRGKPVARHVGSRHLLAAHALAVRGEDEIHSGYSLIGGVRS